MLKILDTALQLVRDVQPLIREIEHHDADLARQLRRALSSVPLNLSEGAHSQGRIKRSRYFTALGSAEESRVALQIAEIHGYIAPLDARVLDRFDHVVRALMKLTR